MNELIYRLDLLDAGERIITSDIRIGERTIEFFIGEVFVGISPRQHLRHWLWAPAESYSFNQVTWFITGGRIGLRIEGFVPGCYLADDVLEMLRQQI